MKTGGRRRDSARFTGEDGLVSCFVIGVGGTFDIGRQRQMTVLFENGENIGWKMQDIKFVLSSLHGDFKLSVDE